MENTKMDIYAYFEIPRIFLAKRILDVGMYLERLGAVSRFIGGGCFSEDIYLCGVEFTHEHLPVIETYYDKMTGIDDIGDEVFDVALCMYIKGMENPDKIRKTILEKAGIIIADKDTWEWLGFKEEDFNGDYIGQDGNVFVVGELKNRKVL